MAKKTTIEETTIEESRVECELNFTLSKRDMMTLENLVVYVEDKIGALEEDSEINSEYVDALRDGLSSISNLLSLHNVKSIDSVKTGLTSVDEVKFNMKVSWLSFHDFINMYSVLAEMAEMSRNMYEYCFEDDKDVDWIDSEPDGLDGLVLLANILSVKNRTPHYFEGGKEVYDLDDDKTDITKLP